MKISLIPYANIKGRSASMSAHSDQHLCLTKSRCWQSDGRSSYMYLCWQLDSVEKKQQQGIRQFSMEIISAIISCFDSKWREAIEGHFLNNHFSGSHIAIPHPSKKKNCCCCIFANMCFLKLCFCLFNHNLTSSFFMFYSLKI